MSSFFHNAIVATARNKMALDKRDKEVEAIKKKYNTGEISREEYDKLKEELDRKFNSKEITQSQYTNDKANLGINYESYVANRAAQEALEINEANKRYDEALDVSLKEHGAAYEVAEKAYNTSKEALDKQLAAKEITDEQYKEKLQQLKNNFKSQTGIDYDDAENSKKVAANISNLASDTTDAAMDAVGIAYKGRPVAGVSPDGVSTGLRAQANEDLRQAGDEQRNAQQNFQIANRNYRDEAGRDAAMKAASQNAQAINNAAAGTGAGAAAMMRQVETPDTQTYMNRQDAQRKEGVENQRTMHAAQQEAIRRNTDANSHDYIVDQAMLYNDAVGALSSNNDKTEQKPDNTDKQDNTPSDNTTDEDKFINAYKNLTAADVRNIVNMINDAKRGKPFFTYEVYPENSSVESTEYSKPAAQVFVNANGQPDDTYKNKLINIYNALQNDAKQRPDVLYKAAKRYALPSDSVYNTNSYNQLDSQQLIQDFLITAIERQAANNGEAYLDNSRNKGTVNNDPNATQNAANRAMPGDVDQSDVRVKNILGILSSPMRK